MIAKMTMRARNTIELIRHKYLGRPYKLHYYDHGGGGPVLIFLHGLASSSANWDILIPLLKHKYRCISIDLIGFGKSPKPDWYDYSMEDHSKNIHATIKSLRLSEPFTLVGHSLGSLLGARYARLHPAQVRHLVLLSPPVYAPLNTIGSRSARQRTSMYLKAYKFIRTHHRITSDNILRLQRLLPFINFLDLNASTWIPFTRSLEQCIENQSLIHDIAQVNCPIDIFYGTFDQVIVPYNIKQLASLKNVTLQPYKVDHVIGRKYAGIVAKSLLSA